MNIPLTSMIVAAKTTPPTAHADGSLPVEFELI
jgi:hypothetical protein